MLWVHTFQPTDYGYVMEIYATTLFSLKIDKLHSTFISSLRNYVFCMPSLTTYFSGKNRSSSLRALIFSYIAGLLHPFQTYLTNNYNGDYKSAFPTQTI